MRDYPATAKEYGSRYAHAVASVQNAVRRLDFDVDAAEDSKSYWFMMAEKFREAGSLCLKAAEEVPE